MSVVGLLQQLMAPLMAGAAASKSGASNATAGEGQGFDVLLSQQMSAPEGSLASFAGPDETQLETDVEETTLHSEDSITLGIADEPSLLSHFMAPPSEAIRPSTLENTPDTEFPENIATNASLTPLETPQVPLTLPIATTYCGLLDSAIATGTIAKGVVGQSYTALPPALHEEVIAVDTPVAQDAPLQSETATTKNMLVLAIPKPETENAPLKLQPETAMAGTAAEVNSEALGDASSLNVSSLKSLDDKSDSEKLLDKMPPDTLSSVALNADTISVQMMNQQQLVAIPPVVFPTANEATTQHDVSESALDSSSGVGVRPVASMPTQAPLLNPQIQPSNKAIVTSSTQSFTQKFEPIVLAQDGPLGQQIKTAEQKNTLSVVQRDETFNSDNRQSMVSNSFESMRALGTHVVDNDAVLASTFSGTSPVATLSSPSVVAPSVMMTGTEEKVEKKDTLLSSELLSNETLPTQSIDTSEITAMTMTSSSSINGGSTSSFEVHSVVGQVVEGAVQAHLDSPTPTKPTQVNLILNPEHLGSVRVQLTANPEGGADAGAIQARFIVSTPEAQLLLTQQLDTLSQRLESQNVRLDRIHIILAPEGVAASQSSSNSTSSGFFQSNDSSPQFGQSGWNQNNQQGPSYQEQSDRQQWFQQLAGGFNGQGQSNTHGNGRSLYATAPLSLASTNIPRTEGGQTAQSPPLSGVDYRIASGTTKISVLI